MRTDSLTENSPPWPTAADLRGFERSSGVTLDEIAAVEAEFGWRFPYDYRAFLEFTNGATLCVARQMFPFFPLREESRHGPPGVLDYNLATRDSNVWPVFMIGSMKGCLGSDENIGFLKTDLEQNHEVCPVVLYWHESGDFDEIAPSFRALITTLAALAPDQLFRLPWESDADFADRTSDPKHGEDAEDNKYKKVRRDTLFIRWCRKFRRTWNKVARQR